MSQQKRAADTTVDVVIPVLNEAHVLRKSVNTVRSYLKQNFPYQWQILVVDNGSTDGTQKVAEELSKEYPGEVRFMYLQQRGRGRALRNAWLQSKADIVCYMDVDLSTDLKHLNELIGSIAEGGYDISTGSRLMRASQTKRSFKREMISRIYNIMVKVALGTKFSDAQCGFKAVSRAAVEQIVPVIEDQSWFFDTELLVLGEKNGYRIKDIPVVWLEDDDSRVKIFQTGWDDIKGIVRLRKYLWRRKFAGAPAADPLKRKQF